MSRFKDQVALVTGASRGLGAAAAIALAAEGAQLILVARTVGGLEETDDAIRSAGGLPATLVPLDLAQGDRIEALAAGIAERYGRLDILVGAAAVLPGLYPAGHIPAKLDANLFAVNYHANARLIGQFDPPLRAAPAGRAVFVTCRAAEAAYWGDYAASKAALETLALAWAAETRRGRLRVNLYDPGPMATALRRIAFPGEDNGNLPRPVDRVAGLLALLADDTTAHGVRASTASARVLPDTSPEAATRH